MSTFIRLINSGLWLTLGLIVAACSDEPISPDSVDDRTAKTAKQLLPSYALPQGNWEGIASCQGRDFPWQVVFSSSEAGGSHSAVMAFSPPINSAGIDAPFGYATRASFAITPRFHAGLLRLNPSGESAKAKSLALLLTPGQSQITAAIPGCEWAVLAVSGTPHAVFTLRDDLQLLQERQVIAEADQQGACPSEMETWIEEGLQLPLDDWGRGDSSALWRDDVAVKVFGKPFEQVSVRERQQYYRALVGRCGEPRNRRRRSVIGLLSRLTDYRSFRDQQMQTLVNAGVMSWYQGYEALVAADPAGDSLELEESRELRRVPFLFYKRGQWLVKGLGLDSDQYRRQVTTLIEGGLAQEQNKLFFAELNDAANNFVRLLALYEKAVEDSDQKLGAAVQSLESNLIGAAENFARTANDPADGLLMAGWIADWPSRDICEAALKRVCKDTRKVFERRLDALTKEWAETGRNELDLLEDESETRETLAAGIAAHYALEKRFGALLQRDELGELREDYDSWIEALQDELEKPLLDELQSAQTVPELRAFETRYFRPGDLGKRDMRKLRAAIEAKWADNHPFNDTGADEYLNALYSQDFRALRRLDASLLAGVRPALALLARQTAVLGSLVGEGAANPFRAVAGELLSPSALRLVSMEYLLHYESRYGKCLVSKAVQFTFSERRDLVTRSSNGFELSRIEGITKSTTYKVKPSLADLFRESFSRPPSAGSERVLSLLLGDNGTEELRSAVGELMGSYSCDSSQIAKFEAGLIAYQRELERRWGS